MKQHLRKIVIGLLTVMFIVSTCGIIWQKLNYRRGEPSYASAEALIDLPTLEKTETVPAEIEEELPETEPIEMQPPVEVETEPETEKPKEEPVQKDPSETVKPVETEKPTEPVERDAYAEEMLKTDLSPLREVNEDVFGWITIPTLRFRIRWFRERITRIT